MAFQIDHSPSLLDYKGHCMAPFDILGKKGRFGYGNAVIISALTSSGERLLVPRQVTQRISLASNGGAPKVALGIVRVCKPECCSEEGSAIHHLCGYQHVPYALCVFSHYCNNYNNYSMVFGVEGSP